MPVSSAWASDRAIAGGVDLYGLFRLKRQKPCFILGLLRTGVRLDMEVVVPCTQDLSRAPARAARDASHRLVVLGARFMRGRVGALRCPVMLGRLRRLARLVALTGAALLLRCAAGRGAPHAFFAPAALPGGSPPVSLALRGGPLAAISRAEQPLAATDVVTNCSDSSTPTPGSLRYEVANASVGDTIAFALPSSCNCLITLTARATRSPRTLRLTVREQARSP